MIGTKLLQKDFSYRGKSYDVYGLPETEDDDLVVDAICFVGTKLNVMHLMTKRDIEMVAYWVAEHRHMDYLKELRDACVDRAIYEREMAKFDHQWRSF